MVHIVGKVARKVFIVRDHNQLKVALLSSRVDDAGREGVRAAAVLML